MKINRLFEMIYMLLNKETITAKEFAKYFNVSVRTIYRYIDDLTTANIPIYMKKGKNGGISLLPNYTLNKITLSDDEKNEILASLKGFKSLEYKYNSNNTINKLSAIFDNAESNWLEVDFTRWKNKNISADTFEKIRLSIISKNKLEFIYYSSKGFKAIRKTHPLKLLYKSIDWYLYAFDEIKEDFRTFKLKRMKNLIVSPEIFIAYTNDISEINTNYDDSKEKNIEVKLEISKELEYFVIEEYDDYKTLNNGNFIININVSNFNEVIPYVLSYGKYCKVLSPLELIDIVKIFLKYL